MTATGYKIDSIEMGGFDNKKSEKASLMTFARKLVDLAVDKAKEYATESKFCYFEAVIAVTGATLEVGYNCAFLLYIFMSVKYLNNKKISTKYFHICVFAFLFATVLK
jgi:hypothetical protein